MIKSTNIWKIIYSLIIVFGVQLQLAAQTPVITGLDKSFAAINDTLTITGSGFGTDLSSIVVQFGASQANVISVSDSEIRALVPGGTTFSSVTVTNTTSGDIGYSSELFFISFGGTTFDPSLLTGPTTFTAPKWCVRFM